MTDGIGARCYTGTIGFDGETVTIEHNWRGKVSGGKAPRVISISDIERIDLKPATRMVNGHLRIAVPGETHDDPMMDRNKVIFSNKESVDVEAVRDAIEQALSERTPEQAAAVASAADNAADAARAARSAAVSASYGKHQIKDRLYREGLLGITKPMAGAVATFESGADRGRPTLTRIGAGAIIAGPVGAIAGGLFKKNKSKCYVTIVFPDGDTAIIDAPVKDETKLRKFAAEANLASA